MPASQDVLYSYVMSFVGTPYKIGGNVPGDGGIDCSGLALIYLQAAGLWPHGRDATAQVLHDAFIKPGSLIATAAFGDLAFFGKDGVISHVGLCLCPSLMLEAGGGDETTTTPAAAAARDAMVRVRPITYRRDFARILRPQVV